MECVPYPHGMEDLPEIGHRATVLVNTHQGETRHEGRVLPPAAPRHLTLKLDNGYNVSVRHEDVVSVEDHGRVEPTTTASGETATPDAGLPRVRIVHTGGTIASKVDYASGAVVARSEPEELIASIPELAQLAALDAVKVGNMFSDDIRPQHWNLMAEAVATAFEDGCRGVVIAHGTDTLHYTSAALNFIFGGQGDRLPGPIVLVGSQRSSDRGSTDATENLLAAVHWAAWGPTPTGHAGDNAVVVMHEGQSDGTLSVHSGLGVRKLHSSRRDAFQPVNAEPLATVALSPGGPEHRLSPDYEAVQGAANPRPVATKVHGFEPGQRIGHFVAGPWLHGEHVEAVIASGVQGLVIHGTGLGHLPIEDAMGDAPENTVLWRTLTRCMNRQLPVVVVNQCIHGPVDMNVYAKGRQQRSLGVLGHGMNATPEAISVKLHWVLSQAMDVAEAMEKNLCGEHRENLRR